MFVHIEVLRCKACQRLAISLDGERVDTQGVAGHGTTKCAGQWLKIAEWGGISFPNNPGGKE